MKMKCGFQFRISFMGIWNLVRRGGWNLNFAF
jgi:hypothetical protein